MATLAIDVKLSDISMYIGSKAIYCTNDADLTACMQAQVVSTRCKNYLNSRLWQRSRDLPRMYYLCQTAIAQSAGTKIPHEFKKAAMLR